VNICSDFINQNWRRYVENNSQTAVKQHGDTLVTLQGKYPILYRKPSKIPVQLIIVGNKLRIRFFVRYSKSMLEKFPGSNLSYADISEAGIRANWSGRYTFPWLADDGFERARAKATVRVLDNNENPTEIEIKPLKAAVRTTVEFIRYGSTTAQVNYPKQRFYCVKLSKGTLFPAHVVSPPWRWYWGFFRVFQLESLYLNWSCAHPGNITLHNEANRHAYQQISAHETGHVLGVGDAYGANYRFFYEAPGTGNYMMCHNRMFQPVELEMVFKSHMSNRMHYFPKEFKSKVFSAGLKRSYRLQFNTLVNKSKK